MSASKKIATFTGDGPFEAPFSFGVGDLRVYASVDDAETLLTVGQDYSLEDQTVTLLHEIPDAKITLACVPCPALDLPKRGPVEGGVMADYADAMGAWVAYVEYRAERSAQLPIGCDGELPIAALYAEIAALREEIAVLRAEKQDVLTGACSQVVGFGKDGLAAAVSAQLFVGLPYATPSADVVRLRKADIDAGFVYGSAAVFDPEVGVDFGYKNGISPQVHHVERLGKVSLLDLGAVSTRKLSAKCFVSPVNPWEKWTGIFRAVPHFPEPMRVE